MKKRASLLVVFMLALFVIPASYVSTPILEGLNKRTFSAADDWEEIGNATVGFQTPDWKQAGNASVRFATPHDPSPNSLSGFNETLPDDVLYYPDVGVQEATSGNVTGGAETNDYTYMLEDDASYWRVTANVGAGSEFYLYFNVSRYIAESVTLFYNAIKSAPITSNTIRLFLYDPNGVDIVLDSDSGGGAGVDAVLDGNVSISDWMSYAYDGGIHTLYFEGIASVNPDALLGDYFHIVPHEGYTESFSDVSDWIFDSESGSTNYAFTSDGDIGTFTYDWLDTGNDWIKYNVSVSCQLESYLEFSWVRATGTEAASWLTIKVDEGGWIDIFEGSTGEWETEKIYLPDFLTVAPTSIQIYINDYANSYDAPYGGWTKFDYLRISKSDEMGWQHDGSTNDTSLINNNGYANVEYLASGDGDSLNVSARLTDGVSKWLQQEILIDGTSTQSCIEETYYPMMKIVFRCGITSDYSSGLRMQVRESDATLTIIEANIETYSTWTTKWYNLYALGIEDIESIEFRTLADEQDESFWIEFDYIKLYSIANYTVSQSSTTTDDYLYTDNGVLYSNIDSGEIILDRDPALNITSPYHSWEMNTTLGTPQISIYTGTWSSYTSNTTGAFPRQDTLSDLRLKFTDNANMNGIIFGFGFGWIALPEAQLMFRMGEWKNIVSAIIRFMVLIDVLQIQSIMMLAGLVMIPVSTLFLVKGGKGDMDRDKVFLFLIIFLFGWAFFLGGIL